MKKVLSVLLLLLVAVPAIAKDVSLSWDASPSDGVTGYRVYYSCSGNTQPFAGTEADQDTPIDVGSALTATATNLPDDLGCYFAVVAYNAAQQESVYSNVVYSPGFTTPDPPSALGGTTTVNNINIPIGD